MNKISGHFFRSSVNFEKIHETIFQNEVEKSQKFWSCNYKLTFCLRKSFVKSKGWREMKLSTEQFLEAQNTLFTLCLREIDKWIQKCWISKGKSEIPQVQFGAAYFHLKHKMAPFFSTTNEHTLASSCAVLPISRERFMWNTTQEMRKRWSFETVEEKGRLSAF